MFWKGDIWIRYIDGKVETGRIFVGQCGSPHINGLVQERHNSSAIAMELGLSYTKPYQLVSARET